MAIKAKKLQPAKTAAVEATKSILTGYNDYIFADYRGLTVEQITQLREKLSEKSGILKVVKNNFARIAFEDLKITTVSDFLKGPTAVVVSKEEANETAKVLYEFKTDAPALDIKGAYIASEIYDTAKLEAFSKLPGKKQLISMIMSTINGPVQKLAATLQAYVDKKSAEGDAKASA